MDVDNQTLLKYQHLSYHTVYQNLIQDYKHHHTITQARLVFSSLTVLPFTTLLGPPSRQELIIWRE